jgi:hypothetical protein
LLRSPYCWAISTDFVVHRLSCVPKLLQSFITVLYFYTFGWRPLNGKFVPKYLTSFKLKEVYIKSIFYCVLTVFVLTVVFGYPWPSSPPLLRITESCLYLDIWNEGKLYNILRCAGTFGW